MITRGSHYSRQLERIYILVRVVAHYQNASIWRKTLKQQENAESMLYKLWALPIRSTQHQCSNHLLQNCIWPPDFLQDEPLYGQEGLSYSIQLHSIFFQPKSIFLGWTSSVNVFWNCFNSSHLKCALFPHLAPEHLSQTGLLYVLQILLLIITQNTLSRS